MTDSNNRVTLAETNNSSNRPTSGSSFGKYGFSPNFYENFLRSISKLLIRILALNGKNRFSNVFIQMLDPICSIQWQSDLVNQKIFFRTGHGRLFWRVKTFFTEEPMMINWLKTFNSNDIFLDIGANVGTYTIPGALQSKLTYACELDPINIGILKENIFLNSLTNKVVIFPFPAADSHLLANIFYRDFSKGDALQSIGHESPLNTVEGAGKHSAIQLAFPLDYVFEKFNLAYPTKVKIDVDGNERTVFGGASNVIFSANEIYFEDSGLKDCEEIIQTILNQQYEIVSRETPANAKLGANLIFRKSKPSLAQL